MNDSSGLELITGNDAGSSAGAFAEPLGLAVSVYVIEADGE